MTDGDEVRGLLDVPSARLLLRQWGRPGDPPLLAVHHLGISGSSAHFAEVGPLLAERHRIRVLAPDLPGFGGSPALAEPDGYRPDRLAGLLLELLDRLGLPRVIYLGSSWGATIGCHLAAAAPHRLAALALLDGGHVDAADQPGFEADASYESRVKAAFRQLEAFRFRHLDDALNRVSDDYPRWTAQLEESWKAGLRFTGGRVRPRLRADVYAAAVHGLAAAPPSATWPAIGAAAVPVLLLATREPADGGEHLRAGRNRFAAAVPQAEVRVVSGYGHDLVAGMGPELVTVVGEWLRGLGLVEGEPASPLPE